MWFSIQRQLQMKKIKRIRPLPFATLQAILLAHIGLLLGILYSFGGLVYDLYTTHTVNYGTALAFLALLGMPAILGVGGFLLGIFEAFLYNLLARFHGGFAISREKSKTNRLFYHH